MTMCSPASEPIRRSPFENSASCSEKARVESLRMAHPPWQTAPRAIAVRRREASRGPDAASIRRPLDETGCPLGHETVKQGRMATGEGLSLKDTTVRPGRLQENPDVPRSLDLGVRGRARRGPRA